MKRQGLHWNAYHNDSDKGLDADLKNYSRSKKAEQEQRDIETQLKRKERITLPTISFGKSKT